MTIKEIPIIKDNIKIGKMLLKADISIHDILIPMYTKDKKGNTKLKAFKLREKSLTLG